MRTQPPFYPRCCMLFTLMALTTMGIPPLAHDADAGTITLTQRESRGRNRVFAGAGPASDLSDLDDLETNLTGPFTFSNTYNAAASSGQGAASADGTISTSDDVVQTVQTSLTLTATRTASGTVAHGGGTGNATSAQRQTFRVRFEVADAPVQYELTGTYHPGSTASGVSSLRLHRPNTTLEFFNITTPTAALNETGTLPLGTGGSARVYELFLDLDDVLSASSSNPGPDSDASTFNIQLTLTSICGCNADMNGDGRRDGLDVQGFTECLTGVGADCTCADVDGQGGVDMNDVAAFVNDLLAGDLCP